MVGRSSSPRCLSRVRLLVLNRDTFGSLLPRTATQLATGFTPQATLCAATRCCSAQPSRCAKKAGAQFTHAAQRSFHGCKTDLSRHAPLLQRPAQQVREEGGRPVHAHLLVVQRQAEQSRADELPAARNRPGGRGLRDRSALASALTKFWQGPGLSAHRLWLTPAHSGSCKTVASQLRLPMKSGQGAFGSP